MTEPDRSKQQAPVDATAPADVPEADADAVETPMLAVWLSLGLIVVAGLYGLYLGTAAKQKPKEEGAATSQLVAPRDSLASAFARAGSSDGRLS